MVITCFLKNTSWNANKFWQNFLFLGFIICLFKYILNNRTNFSLKVQKNLAWCLILRKPSISTYDAVLKSGRNRLKVQLLPILDGWCWTNFLIFFDLNPICTMSEKTHKPQEFCENQIRKQYAKYLSIQGLAHSTHVIRKWESF